MALVKVDHDEADGAMTLTFPAGHPLREKVLLHFVEEDVASLDPDDNALVITVRHDHPNREKTLLEIINGMNPPEDAPAEPTARLRSKGFVDSTDVAERKKIPRRAPAPVSTLVDAIGAVLAGGGPMNGQQVTDGVRELGFKAAKKSTVVATLSKIVNQGKAFRVGAGVFQATA